MREAVVIIENGRVTKSGKRNGATVPRDAERIDAAGLTLLPGLIDCHVHLTNLGEGLDFARELTTPPTLELMRAVRAAKRTLEAGFTAVRDAAGSPAGVRMAIDAGYFPGPRMFVTVSALSQTGGHTDSHFMCGADLDVPLPDRPYMVVDGVENMRWWQALAIGLFQALALVPGVSRAAATVLGGLAVGLNRRTIVVFSFLLAVPTMLAASVFSLYSQYKDQPAGMTAEEGVYLAVGMVVSFVVALVVVRWLLRFVQTHTFVWFGVYRIVAAGVFWWLLFG